MGKTAAAVKALRGPFKKLIHNLEESKVPPKIAKKVEVGGGKTAAKRTAAAAEKTAKKTTNAGDVGSYGDLRKTARGTGNDVDHIPSNASNLAAATAQKGQRLTAAERRATKDSGVSMAVPREVHQRRSTTYGGRNSAERIAQDAADPAGAVRRDFDAYRETLAESGWTAEAIEGKYNEIVAMNRAMGRI